MVFYAYYRIKAISAGGTQKGKKILIIRLALKIIPRYLLFHYYV